MGISFSSRFVDLTEQYNTSGIDSVNKQIQDLEKTIDFYKKNLTQKENEEKYGPIPLKDDFEEFSKYVYTGKDRSQMKWYERLATDGERIRQGFMNTSIM